MLRLVREGGCGTENNGKSGANTVTDFLQGLI